MSASVEHQPRTRTAAAGAANGRSGRANSLPLLVRLMLAATAALILCSCGHPAERRAGIKPMTGSGPSIPGPPGIPGRTGIPGGTAPAQTTQ